MSEKEIDADDLCWISELKTLRRLQPCIHAGSILQVECRLENVHLPLVAKHTITFPSRYALTIID